MKWNATNKSELMTTFFLKNNCIKHIPTELATPFLSVLWADMVEAHRWIESEKKALGDDFYNLTMVEIKRESDIPLPISMPSGKYVDENIFIHIKTNSVFSSTYTINILGKRVIIHFVFEKDGLNKKWKEPNIRAINAYVDNMLLWMHVANKYTTKKCAPVLTVFVYLTSLEKKVPDLKKTVIAPTHVNTGVTTSCPTVDGEIILYRQEEWFKVFIHESFHTLGLDFSAMDVMTSETKIRELFHIPTPILLFEAYTEFWARVMNVLITSFRWTTNSTDNSIAFMQYATFLLDYERVNCFFQLVKVLTHTNIEYVDLHTDLSLLDRYEEKSNVFVYYIITSILLNNYPLFIRWCSENNDKLLQFKQTEEQQLLFCDYIKMNYNTEAMLDGVRCSKTLFKKASANHKKTPSNKKIKTILETLRMSLCETLLV
jgi:hypothetical protein